MIIYLLFALILIAGCTIPVTILTRNYKKISKWDYLYPYLGIPLWFILVTLKIGKTATLANFAVENFYILIISIGTPWIIFILYKITNKANNLIAKILTVLPIIFTILLRLIIESLPE